MWLKIIREENKISIVQPGEKLPATYLERFEPAENVVYRISVLSTAALAVEFHWLDVESKNLKGTYQCIQGMCCQAFGRRSQSYNVPIYVYKNPSSGSTDGDIYVWQMSTPRWKKFSDLALQADLTQWDLTFTSQKRGQGTDWSYSVLPDYRFRDYWPPEQKEQLKIAVESFYQMGESAVLGNLMNYNSWMQLLYDVGYDTQNQCWPGGQSPMNAGAAFQAVNRASVLPPAPPTGFLPQGQAPQALPVAPGAVSGVIFQPSAPSHGSVPIGGVPGNAPPQAQLGYTVNGGVPQGTVGSVPMGSQGQMGFSVSGAPTPPLPSSTSVGAVPMGGQTPPPAVPLGTAPNMPQSVAPNHNPASPPVPQPQAQVNEASSGSLEITAEELNTMIS